MGPIWDIIHTLVAVGTTIGLVMVVWWKLKTDTALLRKELTEHGGQIVILMTTKANAADLIKVTELVAKLESQMLSHHLDAKLHRTEDFEKRIDQLIDSINNYQDENRKDHQRITELIGKFTGK